MQDRIGRHKADSLAVNEGTIPVQGSFHQGEISVRQTVPVESSSVYADTAHLQHGHCSGHRIHDFLQSFGILLQLKGHKLQVFKLRHRLLADQAGIALCSSCQLVRREAVQRIVHAEIQKNSRQGHGQNQEEKDPVHGQAQLLLGGFPGQMSALLLFFFLFRHVSHRRQPPARTN